MKKLVIDQSGMGTEWLGNQTELENVAQIARENAPTGWMIETTTMWNGGGTIETDDHGHPVGDPDSFPDEIWLKILDIHAAENPTAWRS